MYFSKMGRPTRITGDQFLLMKLPPEFLPHCGVISVLCIGDGPAVVVERGC
jgi:hypothetical protein